MMREGTEKKWDKRAGRFVQISNFVFDGLSNTFGQNCEDKN